VHQASLCQLAEASIAPALSAARRLAAQVEVQRRQLAEEELRLQVWGCWAGRARLPVLHW
jgi:hypothetical protein